MSNAKRRYRRRRRTRRWLHEVARTKARWTAQGFEHMTTYGSIEIWMRPNVLMEDSYVIRM